MRPLNEFLRGPCTTAVFSACEIFVQHYLVLYPFVHLCLSPRDVDDKKQDVHNRLKQEPDYHRSFRSREVAVKGVELRVKSSQLE